MQDEVNTERGASKVCIYASLTHAQRRRLKLAASEAKASMSEIVSLSVSRFLGDIESGAINAAEIARTQSRAVAKVLALIRGKAEIGRSELVKRSKLSASDLDSALAELMAGGLISVREQSKELGGPTARIYSAA